MDDDASLLFDLPSEFELAAQILMDRIRVVISNESKTAQTYMNAFAVFEGFYRAHGISSPVNSPLSSLDEISSKMDVVAAWRSKYQRFESDILDKSFKYKSEQTHISISNRSDDFGFSVLTKEEKSEIHSYLNEIREIIESSTLEIRKKNALFNRINALSKEIDKIGTKTDRFFAFLGDLAFVVGDMDDKAAPALSRFERILSIVMGSRAKKEQIKLPPKSKTPQLPAPSSKDA